MNEPYPDEPYGMHAQCLLTGLSEYECDPKSIARSHASRAEALAYTKSFVRLDEPEDPVRFGRIAEEMITVIERSAEALSLESDDDDLSNYKQLRSEIARVFAREFGLPEIRYFE